MILDFEQSWLRFPKRQVHWLDFLAHAFWSGKEINGVKGGGVAIYISWSRSTISGPHRLPPLFYQTIARLWFHSW